MDPHEVILYPLITERTSRMIEKENKITFIVNRKATKHNIKRAIENLYEVRVEKVSTIITRDGNKKAFVRLSPEYNAADLAVRLGIL